LHLCSCPPKIPTISKYVDFSHIVHIQIGFWISNNYFIFYFFFHVKNINVGSCSYFLTLHQFQVLCKEIWIHILSLHWKSFQYFIKLFPAPKQISLFSSSFHKCIHFILRVIFMIYLCSLELSHLEFYLICI
jgi:hypothetical protein